MIGVMASESESPNPLKFDPLPDIPTTDWEYVMRRNMQEIVPGVFLGPYVSATTANLESLLGNGVTHIVCVRSKMEAKIIKPKLPDKFQYLVLDIDDKETENIIQHLPVVREFIENSLAHGGKTLIHGNAGISRSAAIVSGYIMEKYGLQYEQAFKILQQNRYCVNPNFGFVRQLLAYESIYRARHAFQDGNGGQQNVCHKRTIDDVEGNRRPDEMDLN